MVREKRGEKKDGSEVGLRERGGMEMVGEKEVG